MALLGVFGACLLVCVLVSRTPARWVLSAAFVFLVGGAFASRLGWVSLRADSPVVDGVISLAGFAVLFVAGLQLSPIGDSRRRLPLFGGAMLLGVAAITLLVRLLVGFELLPALIVATVLAPTGPRLASLVDRRSRPQRSGGAMTGGLAVPLLVVLLGVAGGQDVVSGAVLPLAGGLALGVALPAAAYLIVRLPGLRSPPRLHPLVVLAVMVLGYAVAHLTGVNPLMTAFAAGVTFGALDPPGHDVSAALGDHLLPLAGGAAVVVFGALLTPALVRGTSGLAWLAVVLVVIIIRPATTAVGRPSRPVLAAAWLEPQLFVTVLLALVVLRSGFPGAPAAYGFLAVAVLATVVLHSVTDVVVARQTASRPASAGSAT